MSTDHTRQADEDGCDPPLRPLQAGFAPTRWTVVLRAQDKTSPELGAALETLCRAYWYPLYAYVRRHSHGVSGRRLVETACRAITGNRENPGLKVVWRSRDQAGAPQWRSQASPRAGRGWRRMSA